MANILSQDEVDSLLQGIEADEPQPDTSPATGRELPPDVRPYDFGASDTSIRGQLPGLSGVFNAFSRRLRNLFTIELAKSVGVELVSVDFDSYDDFLKGLPLPSSMHLIRLDPLRGAAVFVVEADLAYSLVDLFFGGDGQKRTKVEGKGFTSIETSFLGRFVAKMIRGVEEAWEPIVQLKGHYLRAEINPYLLGMAAGDVIIRATYTVNLGQLSGDIILALPLSAIAGVRERLKVTFTVADPESEAEGTDDGTCAALCSQVVGIEVSLQAVVDVLELRIEEIINLRPGDLIHLNRRGMEQVQLWVEDKPILRGRGAQSEGAKVFVVTERCEQQ